MGLSLTAGVRSMKPRKSGVLTQVDCTYEFLDEYTKVSDSVSLNTLERGTGVRMRGARNLGEAWQRLSESGYFDSLPMRTGPGDNQVRMLVKPRLGDASRLAVLQDGRIASEREIAAGMAPAAEYRLPMLTGALFNIDLKLVQPATSQYSGVHMKWEAEYRGTGINIKPGEAIKGIEQGTFLKEGAAYVASLPGPGAWETSACGDKNGLNAYAQASNPDPAHADHDHESLVFTRVVLGTP
jgi:hypothetical protein